MELKKRFEQLINPGYFVRAESEHILDLFIGLDGKGRYALELRAKYDPVKVTGTSCVEVNQYKRNTYNTLLFSLTDESLSGLFFKFCEDILDYTRNIKEKSEGYKTVIGRFLTWRKMFVPSKKQFLTEPAIMGLIGEILFLRNDLGNRIGLSAALKSWSGQDLTHKDFSYGNKWSEVKAISSGVSTVKISSLEQLDSKDAGELAVYMLEKMSPEYKGITLNSLILQTRDMFVSPEDRDVFMAKVSTQGYSYDEYYDDIVYEIVDKRKYRVSDGFPKLTKRSVPVAIIKAEYRISLADISEFELKDQETI